MRANSKLTCLEQDAMNTESTVSLIMGASAADLSAGERATSTDVPLPPGHGQS
jgi:hypothetical protein